MQIHETFTAQMTYLQKYFSQYTEEKVQVYG